MLLALAAATPSNSAATSAKRTPRAADIDATVRVGASCGEKATSHEHYTFLRCVCTEDECKRNKLTCIFCFTFCKGVSSAVSSFRGRKQRALASAYRCRDRA